MRKYFFMICLFCLLFVPLGSVHAIYVWSENFDDLDEWSLAGYVREGITASTDNILTNSIPSGFSNENGRLTSSYNFHNLTTGNGNISYAFHPNNISYGSWNFDVFIDNWTTTIQNFGVKFIYQANSNYNLSRKKVFHTLHEAGFNLQFRGIKERDSERIDLTTPSTTIFTVLDNSKYNLFHNILITRNLNGEFKVYLDSELIITHTDNRSFVSDTFEIHSFDGRMIMDNITVLDLVCTPEGWEECLAGHVGQTPSGFEFIYFPILIVVIFVRRKSKK